MTNYLTADKFERGDPGKEAGISGHTSANSRGSTSQSSIARVLPLTCPTRIKVRGQYSMRGSASTMQRSLCVGLAHPMLQCVLDTRQPWSDSVHRAFIARIVLRLASPVTERSASCSADSSDRSDFLAGNCQQPFAFFGNQWVGSCTPFIDPDQ